MDTKKSIRERRQERIRRIMEHNNSTLPLKQAMQQPQAPLLPMPSRAELPIPLAKAVNSPRTPRDIEDDPERLWKANPNPWESAGWRIAPLPSKDVKASKQGGPESPPPRDYRFIVRGLFIQTAIAGALFIIVFALFKLDVPAAKQGQQVVTSALTDEMNFDAAAELYKDWFAGAPSFIPLFGDHRGEESELAEGAVDLPIVSPLQSGTVVRTFAETLSGIELAGEPGQEIVAAETGRVLVVSNDDELGETVVVQHANDRVSIYGHLGLVRVAVNDWIEAGKTIGKLPVAEEGQQSLLYFAVKDKGQYVDPADVVPID